jgi:Domain of unknown function (DUF4838)/Glycosyl hydrolases family 2, sugar binding domain
LTRRRIILLVVILALAPTFVHALNIATDGQPLATIIVPDDALPVVRFAAEELQYHVRRASGAELPILTESKMPESGALVILGACHATVEAGITPESLEPNEWVGKLTDDRLYLAGDDSDGPAAWILHGNRTRVGTLFAVYELIEQEMGVLWLWPGELGELIPAAKSIAVDTWDVRGKPAFVHTRWRDGGPMLTGADGWAAQETRSRFLNEQGKWLRRHRFAMGRNMDMAHAFTKWWDKYGETHPEYFNLLPDGTRRSDPNYFGGSTELISMSVGNPDFHRAVVEHWLETRTPQKPWIDCSENDTPGKCMCALCMAQDEPDPELDFPWEEREQRARDAFAAGDKNWVRHLGALSDRYARYYLAVLEEAQKHDPDAVVMGYAYANTVNPPLNTTLNPSVIIGVVPPMYYPWTGAKRDYNRRQWEGWAATGPRMFLRPNWMLDGHNLPLFLARKLGDDFRFYAANGLIGTDFDSLTGQYATQGPNLYMLTRLHQKPEMSVDAVLDEYYSAFGSAENAVRDYFAHWERVANEDRGEIIEGLHWSHFYRQAHVIFTPEVMARGRELLDRAAEQARGDRPAEERVAWLSKGLRNAELVLETQRAYEGYRERGDFDGYLAALKVLDEYRASVEGDLIGNFSALYTNEQRTWDRKLVQIMEQQGERLPDPWRFAWDPDGIGEQQGWWADDFDDTGWPDIGTDGPWEQQPVGRKSKQEHSNEDYNGLAWYRTTFSVTEKPNRPIVQLVFGAVDEACTVWVNGTKLLDRPYPYQGNSNSWQEAFEVDISQVVRYGTPNTVAVRVSDESGAGGLWRPVWVNTVAPAASDAANLVRDGGFEGEAAAWGRSAMAGKFSFRLDPAQTHSGRTSGRLECTERGTAEDLAKFQKDVWLRWYQSPITVSPKESYRLRLWVRTPAGFSGRVAIWVTGTTEGTNDTNLATTNGRWHEVVVDGIRPAGEAFGIYLNLMDAPGVAWFDDVELLTSEENGPE